MARRRRKAGSRWHDRPAGKEWYVGGSFDFKVVKMMASYQEQNDKNPANNDNTLWQVGGIVPVGNANIHLGYAGNDQDGQGALLFGAKS
jgi:predicted porin